MTTDTDRLAKLREIDERWWGVHTSTDLDTGRVTYGSAHRHAGEDVAYLLTQVKELTQARADAETRAALRVTRVVRYFWRGRSRCIASNEAQWRVINQQQARAARDAARLADHLALLNLEEAVRCMMTHHNWRECAKVPNALANLDRQRAATPRPDAGLCAVCGGTRTVRSRYTLLGGQVIEQDEPCGDCAPRPDAGQGVG